VEAVTEATVAEAGCTAVVVACTVVEEGGVSRRTERVRHR
jgi:hypothetical protein